MNAQQLFGIQLPIIQAPMAGVQASALTIAVSQAGGLGSLPCAMLTHDALRAELAAIAASGIKTYHINFFAHTPPVPDATRETEWRESLAPYYREYGIDAASIPTGPGRMPFSPEALEIIAPFKPPVVSFHFGLPSDDLLAPIRAWGGKILSSATTLAEARWLAARGVDAIIAQGLEAGGHRGMFLSDDLTTQIGTLPLVRQIVRSVEKPVIAAGGIADAEGVAAVLQLGAIAAQVGTAYLLCDEATTSALHRKALQSRDAEHTALTNLFTGRPARGIVNRVMREQGPISTVAPAFPLATSAVAPLRAKAEAAGSGDFSPLWSGQNPSGCRAVPAADLTRALAALV